MNFAIGYQRPGDGDSFSKIVLDYASKISEVYFPWIGVATGRSVLDKGEEATRADAQKVLESDLKCIRKAGKKLDLLLNGNCYGADAISLKFEKEILALIEHLDFIGCLPEIVTTTSFFVAGTLKKHFSGIEIRASVNMKLCSIGAMEYASEYFDSFYIGRDIQRNADKVKEFHEWCASHGKKLGMLANSGCLRCCPAQTFHDNLVAHSSEAQKLDNVTDWNPHLCHRIYAKRENYVNILRSTWIRPEDLHRYEGSVDVVKLATRQHSHPRKVIDAYTRGRYYGNILELFEPGFSYLFVPYYIDNGSFPGDWGERTTHCCGECSACGYCDTVLPEVLKEYGSFEYFL